MEAAKLFISKFFVSFKGYRIIISGFIAGSLEHSACPQGAGKDWLFSTTLGFLKGNDDKLNTSIGNLTDSNTIKYVKLVNTLPADAASHPDTVYLIKS